MREQRFSVVVPTTGRPGPGRLVEALAGSLALADRAALDLHEIVVVDDRPGFPPDDLKLPAPDPVKEHLRIVRSGGRGPAGARNAGWRSTSAAWVVFLDDDAEPSPTWADDLVARLETATGPTVADLAYRREHLDETYGFDERTPVTESSRTTLLLAAAAAAAAVGLTVRRIRVAAVAAALGLGATALAQNKPSPRPWPPTLRAVLFTGDAPEAIELARGKGLQVRVLTDPTPEAIAAAAPEFGLEPYECGLIGERPADALAAYAAGARPVLVPAGETDDGIAETADSFVAAVNRLSNH